MITTCTHCSSRYRLDAAKVPERVIQVRCPACQGVFTLDGTAGRDAAPAATRPESLISGFESGSAMDFTSPGRRAAEAKQAPPKPAPAADPFAGSRSVFDAAPALQPAAQLDNPSDAAAGRRSRRRSKEEMLARALVSDILVYNRDMRDKALANGNLAEAMKDEIKKSWELYKEKVSPEVAKSSECFREALNEILAEGEKVF